jgi:murein DD-endopeptidase MepM/ murein hydrolase activator NlpD
MKFSWKTLAFIFFGMIFIVLLSGFLLPEVLIIPVKHATKRDWDTKSFWFSPWGQSGVHKGIDIFAKEGTPVIAACSGFVVSADSNKNGGNVISILAPKWRIHYYAHLKTIKVIVGELVNKGTEIGSVGTTGNAAGKVPHLHYAIITQIPYVWKFRSEKYGFERMFFLNPHEILTQ